MQIESQAIVKGYPYTLRIQIVTAPSLFPSGLALKGAVKASRSDTAHLALLTTSDGTISRVSDTEVDIMISAEQTAGFPADCNVAIDFVRTDIDPTPPPLFFLLVPVMLPVTRQADLT